MIEIGQNTEVIKKAAAVRYATDSISISNTACMIAVGFASLGCAQAARASGRTELHTTWHADTSLVTSTCSH